VLGLVSQEKGPGPEQRPPANLTVVPPELRQLMAMLRRWPHHRVKLAEKILKAIDKACEEAHLLKG
jgi:hypothetical protein